MTTLPYQRFAILSGCNPRHPVRFNPGPDPHGALAASLIRDGFNGRMVETHGRYGGAEEPGFMVEVRTAEELRALMTLARAFGQESILYSERHDGEPLSCFMFTNGDGPCSSGAERRGFAYGPSYLPPEGGDNYTAARFDPGSLTCYFTLNVG